MEATSSGCIAVSKSNALPVRSLISMHRQNVAPLTRSVVSTLPMHCSVSLALGAVSALLSSISVGFCPLVVARLRRR